MCVHVLGWRAQLYVVYNKAITITRVWNVAVCIVIMHNNMKLKFLLVMNNYNYSYQSIPVVVLYVRMTQVLKKMKFNMLKSSENVLKPFLAGLQIDSTKLHYSWKQSFKEYRKL